MDKYRHTLLLLEKLEQAMKEAQCWQAVPPSPEALSSTQPFSIDTLTCTEWLQWVFIPKMHQLVVMNMPLPKSFAIAPYVEEALAGADENAAIVAVAKEFDSLFSSKKN